MGSLLFRFSNKFLFTALLILSLDASANAFDKAVKAMHSGDFSEAYCIMRPFAEAGNADAQYHIGWMYLNGYGLRVNDSIALEWWQKSSSQGYGDASFSIGMLYSLGEGKVAKDSNKAIDYYLLALEDGHEDAVTMLRSMMLRNDRVIRGRLHLIVSQHASLFGVKRQVKAIKLNARKGPTVEDEIVAQLIKGQTVLEINKQGRWSQVVILDDKKIDRAVWVYNPMLEKPANLSAG